MPGLSVSTKPLINKKQPTPGNVGSQVAALRSVGIPGFEDMAAALETVQANLDQLNQTTRNVSPAVTDIVVTDSQGRIIAALGEFIPSDTGVSTSGGMFAELYAGFALGVSDPAQAILKVTPDGAVTIGQNGWIDVLDPFGGHAAWLGTQYDVVAVTGAANNGSGLIRLTVPGHTYITGDGAIVLNVGGVPNATGIFIVTAIDASHIDLQQSVFVGTYTSGGTVDRLLHVTGVANASGLIRITTAVAHGYTTGDQINALIGGNGNGQWIVKVIDSTHIDLIGSTFTSGYSNGTIIRYFAGGLFETIAVAGTSFTNAKLKAQANGDLLITDAFIKLVGVGIPSATITLDPDNGVITIQDNNSANFITLSESGIALWDGVALDTSTFIAQGIVRVGVGLAAFSTPNVTIFSDSVTLQDTAGTTVVSLSGTSGNATCTTLNVSPVAIDGLGNATGFNSIDSALYKIGGTNGFTVTQTVVQSISPVTANFVNSVSGTGVTSTTAPAMTGFTVVTKALVFNGGLITNDI